LQRFAQIRVAARWPNRFARRVRCDETVKGRSELSPVSGKQGKVSCEGCFFKQNLLCALPLSEPCATYRPNHPEGLRPPTQMRFVFRQERRRQAAWAFPSASEQAALHA
jgi:hypothetical protein